MPLLSDKFRITRRCINSSYLLFDFARSTARSISKLTIALVCSMMSTRKKFQSRFFPSVSGRKSPRVFHSQSAVFSEKYRQLLIFANNHDPVSIPSFIFHKLCRRTSTRDALLSDCSYDSFASPISKQVNKSANKIARFHLVSNELLLSPR